MAFSDILTKVANALKSHSPEILTAIGVGGVVTTSYLTAKASFQACRKLDARGTEPFDRKERIKEQAKLVWKDYIPPAVSGAVTIGCIIGSSKVSGRRTAAAVAAYSITERAFSEYRDKVVDQIGKNKEQKIRDEIAQDHVSNRPSREVVVTTVSGHVLCCELYTGRYLRSDMETLRKAQNDLNKILIDQVFASLDEFYDLINMPYTSNSCMLGWDSDRLMDLAFSTVISDNGEPCLAFEYNYVKPIRN
jgi:Family of unknown function (DUF6353)